MSAATPRPNRRFSAGSAVRYVLLSLGAVAFLFPFYYMIVGCCAGRLSVTCPRRSPRG